MSNLPVPQDPVTAAIDKSIEEAATAAKEFAEKLLGPGLDHAGGLLGDRIAFWRFKNRIEIILKAKAFLEGKGIDPRRVLPKAAMPILDAGSLEESAAMREKWAAMLAHAASPNERMLLPAFPKILSELSHGEVKALDRLCATKGYKDGEWNWIAFEADEFSSYCDVDALDSVWFLENLTRLGLVGSDASSEWIGKEAYRHPYAITMLGFEFIRLCRAL